MDNQKGKSSEGGQATDELMKCVWMISGTISYKLCDRQYECEGCSFDIALRQKPAARLSKKSARRTEALTLKGTSRVPGLDSSMPSSWIQSCNYSEGLFYHPGHFWARVEEEGTVRIGVDDFAQKLLGRIYSVGLPRVSSQCNTLDHCLRIVHQAGEIALPAPLPGEVKEVNGILEQRPSLVNQDPYMSGWLMVLEPDSLAESLKSLYYGQQAKEWLPGETIRLQQLIEKMISESRPDVGATLQDGGLEVIEDLTKLITPAQHRRIIDTFITSAAAGKRS